ncbi:hypothetical protein GH733_008078 [Mirounga leonina]|nr:hypothetical protein GH733_008078 [Mirounga leonina]
MKGSDKEEIEAQEKAKGEREWRKNFEESQDGRVDSWRNFQANTKGKKEKKNRTFQRPRKVKMEQQLLHDCEGQLKGEAAQMAAYYEHHLQLGSKAIYHVEAFVAKFMALYKKFMEDGLESMMF